MTQPLKVYAICQCGFYDFSALNTRLVSAYTTRVHRDVLQLNWSGGEAYVFSYGVIVFWNVTEDARKELLATLIEFAEEPVTELLDDHFTYELNAAKASLKTDHICLPDDKVTTRLALSHGLAQSTKLSQYETRVQHTITKTEYIPQRIADTGKSGLRRKELSKLRGLLYLTKSDVMLHYDLLDVPEFFWEQPEFQPIYLMISDYLETKPRIEVLNKKLETIQDLLQMIADEQDHSHSSLLEWIIIWLIAIDIIIVLLQTLLT
jgi:uncharacterized Rmd1/YagE family protein